MIDFIRSHILVIGGLACILFAIWPERKACGCSFLVACDACSAELDRIDSEIDAARWE